jgi:hypothetical protein
MKYSASVPAAGPLYRWKIQNGSNLALKAYARETLPKIDDHLHRVEAWEFVNVSAKLNRY